MEMVTCYMKIMGNICIITSGISFGWIYGNSIEKRYRELNDLQRNFQMIHSDISYGASSFGEILNHVQEYSMSGQSLMFQYMESEMKKKSKRRFAEIWNEGIEIHLPMLNLEEQDIIELKRVGQSLGNVNKNQQLIFIQSYLDKLQKSIEELERGKNQKIKLYRMIGTLGSIFIVVILL